MTFTTINANNMQVVVLLDEFVYIVVYVVVAGAFEINCYRNMQLEFIDSVALVFSC